jgi:hypothetical protein
MLAGAPTAGLGCKALPLFCRHNRHTVDCPICSREEGLAEPASSSPRPARPKKRAAQRTQAAPTFKGPYGTAGPYQRDEGTYEVRLERVPGGLRLAEWADGRLQKRAPVVALADFASLVQTAADNAVLEAAEADTLRSALDSRSGGEPGVSPGRSGELRDELRVEELEGGRVRIGRWLHRGALGWELQEAPIMLPARRYAEALRGVSGRAVAERPH